MSLTPLDPRPSPQKSIYFLPYRPFSENTALRSHNLDFGYLDHGLKFLSQR